MASVDKLERLLTLTATLLETPRPLSAEELRERVPGYPDSLVAFRRAFERDKEDLRELGIPISVEPVDGADPPVDGYTVHRDAYELPDPGLEPDELAALNLAATMVRLDGFDGDEALRKLGGAVAGTATPGEASPIAALPRDPALVDAFASVVERRTISFSYRRGERLTQRRVEPHRLDHQRGRWYLSGRDVDIDEQRVFRLDRVVGAISTGPPDSFVPPDSPEPGLRAAWEMGDGEEVLARLRVDASHAGWAARHLGEGATAHPNVDGSVTFEVAVTSWPAFRAFVLSFLDHAELLEPPELRSELVSWLERIEATVA